MGIGALNYQGVKGGVKLNDVIEEFKYVYQGQTITAGDFVEYVNGVASTTTKSTSTTTISSAKNSCRHSAVLLDDTRVFVAHGYDSDSYLYGIVLTITNGSISKGTDTAISSLSRSGYLVSVSKLQDGRVFIAHPYSKSYFELAVAICSIDGTTITVDKNVNLGIEINSYGDIESISWGSNEVLITYDDITGLVCSVSGTTITQGTETTIVSATVSGQNLALLPSGYILMSYIGSGSNQYLKACVLSVSGTTVSLSRNSTINGSLAGSGIGAWPTILDDTRIFISHSDSVNSFVYGIVCTISGTSISKGTDILLAQDTSSRSGGCRTTSVAISNERAIVFHGFGSSPYLYGFGCVISGATITAGTSSKWNSTDKTGTRVKSLPFQGNMLLFHSYGIDLSLKGALFNLDNNNEPVKQVIIPTYEQQAKLATQPPFDGIALSDGVGGTATAHNQQVQISRPNV